MVERHASEDLADHNGLKVVLIRTQKITQPTRRRPSGGKDRRSSVYTAIEVIFIALRETSIRAAMSEDDTCALRANSNTPRLSSKILEADHEV